MDISCRTKLYACNLLKKPAKYGRFLVLGCTFQGQKFCYQKVRSKPLNNPSFSIYFIDIQLVNLVRQAFSLKGFGVHVIGQVAVFGGAFSYALAAIYGRRFQKIDPVVVATGMLCSSTIMMIPMTLIVEQPWNLTPGMITWAEILGV